MLYSSSINPKSWNATLISMELKTCWATMPILTSNSSSSVIAPFLRRRSAFCYSTSYRYRTLEQGKSSFFGNNTRLRLNPFQHQVGLGLKGGGRRVVVAVIKRRKEMPLDSVIQRQKKLKMVSKIRDILVKQPNRMMSLRELGKYRRDLGLTRKRRVIALLKKYPGVFEIVEEGVYSLYFRLTPPADKAYLEEMGIRQEMEERLVTKLRKIVMMSMDKRVPLERIGHLKQDLGLPDDFKTTMCTKYPQYFKVVSSPRGLALELTSWDPALAVSAAELGEAEAREREISERNLIIDRPPKFNRVLLPKGLNLKRSDRERLRAFKEMPFFSPYADIKDLNPASMQAEKHACAVVHELLSLTIEKRTLVDHLTHFRDDYKFSQRIRAMLIRHPDMFYVSLKGIRDSVFLREAYRDSELIEKDPLVIAKERLQALVSIGRFQKQHITEGQVNYGAAKENGEFLEEDEDEAWSDAEGDDVDSDDEWSDSDNDEERKSPPFRRSSSPQDKAKILLKAVRRDPYRRISLPVVKKELSTVTPDDRPRERW